MSHLKVEMTLVDSNVDFWLSKKFKYISEKKKKPSFVWLENDTFSEIFKHCEMTWCTLLYLMNFSLA